MEQPLLIFMTIAIFTIVISAMLISLTMKQRESRKKSGDLYRRAPSRDQMAYLNVVGDLPDGVIVIQDERIVYTNPTAYETLGYRSTGNISGVHYTSLVAPESRSFADEIYKSGMRNEAPVRNYDLRFLKNGGGTIDLEVNSASVKWNRRKAVLLTMRDVGERKKNEKEQAQWLWEQELLNSVERQLVSTVNLKEVLDKIVYHARLLARADIAAVLTIDPEKESYRWLAMKGNHEEFSSEFIPLGPTAKEFYHECEPKIIYGLRNNNQYRHEDFPLFDAEEIALILQYPLTRGSIVFGHLAVGFRKRFRIPDSLLQTMRSFTERAVVAIMNAELYDQLLRQTKDLQKLYETRTRIQEEERRRIATELHDSLGQLLSSIKLHLNLLEDSKAMSEDSLKVQINEIRTLLDNAITEARNISYDLRPAILDDFGLVPALEVLCDKFSSRTGVPARFQSHNLHMRLPNQLETALYRIAQEALNNVQKHASATEVNVQVIRAPGVINLVIEDNGKGFLPAKVEQSGIMKKNGKGNGGLGLISMRERAICLNGVLTVDSTPGKGTDIIIEIPLTEAASNGENSGSNS